MRSLAALRRRRTRRVLALEQFEARQMLTGDPVTFAVLGDYGYAGPVLAEVSSLIRSWNPDFILTVGDNNYEDGAAATIDANVGQYFHDYIAPYLGSYGTGADINRFFPTVGNHDWGSEGLQPYLDYFTLPGNERYYSFSWGPVDVFVVNSDVNEPDGRVVTSVQAQWLQAQLAASTATWKVVSLHHPPFSSGVGAQPKVNWPFREWGASVVLTGHEHFYERIERNGIPYLINGVGGKSLDSTGVEATTGSELRFNADYGAMLVEASEADLSFRFYTRAGQLIDHYTLSANSVFPKVTVSATSPVATEGGTAGAFSLVRSGDTADDVTVHYTVSGDSIPGVDFGSLSGSVTIPAGVTEVALPITAIDDGLLELPETVTVTIAMDANYNVGGARQATVTIADNDVTGPILSFESRILASADDAEQRSTTSVILGSTDLDLVTDGTDIQTVGLRFANLAIPANSQIVNAYVQFMADETSSGPTSLTIHGEASGNSPVFTTKKSGISTRPRTTAAATWAPSPWVVNNAGISQRTPNLASLIQEIVGRADWQSGNALSLIISGSGSRAAESYDGNPAAAPLLHLDYVVGASPAATNLNQTVSLVEDATSVDLADIVVTDPDVGDVISARLTLQDPFAGTLTTGTFGSVASSYNSVTGIWSATGSAADVSAALAAVAFVPAAERDIGTSILTHVEDASGHSPGDGTIVLTVTPINDPPTVVNLSHQITYPRAATSVALQNLVICEVDTVPVQQVTARLTLSDPAAGALSTGTFGGATSTYEVSTGRWEVSGAVADVNAALADVSFLPQVGQSGSVNITTHVSDQDGTGPGDGLIELQAESNIPPTAVYMNQSHSYLEDATLVTLTPIQVSDANTVETVRVRLTVVDPSTGALSTGVFGGTASSYDPASGIWEAIGQIGDVNAALAAVGFLPAANNDRDTTITVHVEDLAGSGPADGVIVLDATPINDPPVTTGLANLKVPVGTTSSAVNLFAAFADIENADPTLLYSIEANSNPALFAGLVIDPVQGSLTLNYAGGVAGTATLTVRATDGGAPALFAETALQVTVSPIATVDVRVSASADDAEERATTSVVLGSTDLELVFDLDTQVVGMRFAGLAIPQNAVITRAWLQFQADESSSGLTDLVIQGQATGNAATFTTKKAGISSRPRTATAVSWSPAPWTKNAAGPDQRTPELAAIVQEIVNRGDWVSGNALVLIVTGTGSRIAESFEGNAAAAPLLHVEYYY